jgi:two-component system chemotaxis sensor kinase CheA
MKEHHAEFIIEARDHLAVFERSLLALEKAVDGAESQLLIQQALRAIHSLKGDSGFLGFQKLRELAHAMESVLEDYRDGSVLPPGEITELLLNARDRLAVLVDDLTHSDHADIEPILRRLLTAADQGGVQRIPVRLRLTDWQNAESGRSLMDLFRRLDATGTVSDAVLSGYGDPGMFAAGSADDWNASVQLQFSGTLLTSCTAEDVKSLIGDDYGLSSAASSRQSVELNLTELQNGNSVSLTKVFQDIDETCTVSDPQLRFICDDLAVGLPASPIVWRAMIRAGESLPSSSRTNSSVREQLAATNSGEISATDFAPSLISATETFSATETTVSEDARPNVLAPVESITPRQPITPVQPAVSVQPAAQSRSAPPERTAVPVSSEAERLRSLRINVELLDRLMNLIGELTLIRNQTQVTFGQEQGESRNLIQRLSSVTSELQGTVLQTRMQPVGNLFGRFPRMVRDLARQLGKEVEIVTVGQEVELDKTVIERLSDPLMHLIRNSIDHGLEMPEAREGAGKARCGKIVLSATPADGQVCIEIRDDGRGIDPVAVRNRAATMGLRTEADLDRMSNRELFSLILLPGFSTAKSVTDVSGRGVGMDVVKTNVEELDGSLTIDSWPGAGTSMLLRVPLTLAIVPCLIVTVGTQRYAVPQRELEEVVCLHPQLDRHLEQAFDTEVLRLRDSLLPVIRFAEVLERRHPFTSEDKAEILARHGSGQRDPNQVEYVLILRSRGRRVGLLVDSVRGREEIVVKPIHPALKQVGVFSGATLMGDGRVALIANVEGIVEHAQCYSLNAEVSQTSSIRDPHEVHRVLLFEYGPHEQFALPLIQVRRVELLEMNRIERIGDRDYITIDGRATRILRLTELMNVSSCDEPSTMFLILPKFVPEPIGILVHRIIDTESLAIEMQSTNERGVLGTAVVRDRLSLFLDVQQLREFLCGRQASTATPADDASSVSDTISATRSQSMAASVNDSHPQRILLVDDTPFFRQVVTRYLADTGADIVTGVDGRQGLELLSSQHFDLVISDIEMPVMDGWQFCMAARERGFSLPFVALTSLAKAEHEQKARACGFDDFEEKLDHDRLRQKVLLWLKRSAERTAVR